MKEEDLEGITFDGKSLKSQIKKFVNGEISKTMGLVDPEVQEEFNKDHHIYRQRKVRFPKKEENTTGEVMNKWLEVNQANLKQNIKSAIEDKDVKKAIVSVLLASEEYRSLVEIFDVIEGVARVENVEDKLFFKAHSLRNHIGIILKSEFSQCLDIKARGSNSTEYKLNTNWHNRFSVEEAMKLVNAYVPEKQNRKTKIPQKDQDTEFASFSLQGSNGKEINVRVFGKIQIEFSFK